MLADGDVLHPGQRGGHQLVGHGGPHAVLHQAGDAALEVLGLEVGQEGFHRREQEPVVGGAGQHHLAAAESLGHRIGDVGAGQVHLSDGRAGSPQLFGHLVGGLAGVTVDGSRSHQDRGGLLGLVAGPGVVQAQVGGQVAVQHRAVQGADLSDVQAGSLFEQGLDLGAVLAHDVQEVPAGIVGPVGEAVALGHHAEPAKAVGREQHLLAGLIADHHLGPVHHGGKDEVQGVAAQAEGVAVLDGDAAAGLDGAGEEVFQIGKGLGVAHHLHGGVLGGQAGHVGRVVRLHMGHHQVIGGLAGQLGLQSLHPRVGGAGVHRVHDGGLFVPDQVAVVADAAGDGVLALKQIEGGIVDADAQDGIRDVCFVDVHG